MTAETFNMHAITQYFNQINLITLLDLAVVTFIIWGVVGFLGKTRGIQIAKGLLFLYIFKIIGSIFKLSLVSELFETLYHLVFYSLPIIFQREIRIALENFGRIRLLKSVPSEQLKDIREICKATNEFTKKKIGSLIVIERTTPLNEYTSTATELDAKISYDLLSCIFKNQSTLHDGAVLVRDNRVLSAKCILPLSEITDDKSNFGTRHRAAVGITEVSDCIAIVTSEETGQLSIGYNGNIIKITNPSELEQHLIKLFNLSQRKRILLFE